MADREESMGNDHNVSFSAEGRRAPLMWSQEMYWYLYHLPLPVVDSAKIQMTIRMPGPGVAENAVLAAVRRLMSRHEALRTLYPTDRSGAPFQLVLDRFADPLPIRRNGNRPEDVQAVFHALFVSPMDQAVDLPLRVGFTLEGRRVATLVLLLNHISADAASLPLIRADLERYLSSPNEADPAPTDGQQMSIQPLALADQQRSGMRDSVQRKALRHCEDVLSSAPAAQFPRFRPTTNTDPRTGIESHYRQVSLQSPQLFSALQKMRRNSDFSVPARISVIFTVAIAAISGNPRAVFKMNLSNRFREVRKSVGCFFQEALVSVQPLSHLTIEELMVETKRRIFVAARHAQYSYLNFRDLKTRVESERGAPIRLGTILNCSEKFEERLRISDTPARSAEAQPSSSMKTLECLWRDEYTDLCLKSYAVNGEVVLDLIAHRSVMEQDEIERLLTGMEQFLISWADEPDLANATVSEVVRRFGLPVSRYGEGWAYVDHSWVNTAKLERIIRSVEGVEAALVGVVERPSRERVLVARLVGEPTRQATVRARVLAALREEADLMCPHEFVWCDELPEPGASMPAGTGAATTTADAGDVPDRPALGAGDRAFAAALAVALGDAPIDMDSSYARQGGSAVMAPAVVKHLAQLGFAGPTPDDLLGPWPLRTVAQLCTAHHDSAAFDVG
ncbi:condensation domain-containing protein [Streptomyces sp. NPDC088258]|uniref:condensation domain-containing protein n=1 Tax=Streptomyces sp. NPDC088258 TaxID=3365849 RepID=UPI00380BC7C2